MPVEFQEDKEFARPSATANEPSRFIRLVLSTGIVSTEKDAEYVLLGLAGAAVFIAILIFIYSLPNSKPAPAPPPPSPYLMQQR